MALIHTPRPPDALVERAVAVGDSELLWLAAAPFAVACRPARAQRELKLLAVLEGGGVLVQGGRRAELAAGRFAWLDSDAPFELALSAGRRLIVRLPAPLVRDRHPEVDLRTAVARGVDHPGERVVGQLMCQLGHDGAALSDAACAAAANTIVEAVGMCAREPRDPVAARVARALGYVAQRLGDPRLQPTDVARQQGVSRRYLDGLVRRATGHSLATHIRVRRLERAAQDLASQPTAPAAEIATRWGFVDASHFTRRFRGHFGVTPTAYRGRRRDRTS